MQKLAPRKPLKALLLLDKNAFLCYNIYVIFNKK